MPTLLFPSKSTFMKRLSRLLLTCVQPPAPLKKYYFHLLHTALKLDKVLLYIFERSYLTTGKITVRVKNLLDSFFRELPATGVSWCLVSLRSSSGDTAKSPADSTCIFDLRISSFKCLKNVGKSSHCNTSSSHQTTCQPGSF